MAGSGAVDGEESKYSPSEFCRTSPFFLSSLRCECTMFEPLLINFFDNRISAISRGRTPVSVALPNESQDDVRGSAFEVNNLLHLRFPCGDGTYSCRS